MKNYKTSKTLKYLPVEPTLATGSNRETTDLKVSVFYDKGGQNYFNGEVVARGYYLSVKPVTVEQQDGYKTEVFALFSGLKKRLFETGRFNQKFFDALDVNPEIVNSVVEAVLAQSGLKLKEVANV